MIMFRKAIVSLAALAMMSLVPAGAQDTKPSSGVFKTSQQIRDLCVSDQVANQDSCDYFIMAAHDMIKFFGDTDMIEGDICLPVGIKAVEVREVVLAYWRANPGNLKFSAVSSIHNALVEKYDC